MKHAIQNQNHQAGPSPPMDYRTLYMGKLITVAQCERATGFSTAFITAVKNQPDTPFSGRYTTIEKFERWVWDHPQFRSTHYWGARKKDLEELRKLEAMGNGTFKRGMKFDAASVRRRAKQSQSGRYAPS